MQKKNFKLSFNIAKWNTQKKRRIEKFTDFYMNRGISRSTIQYNFGLKKFENDEAPRQFYYLPPLFLR